MKVLRLAAICLVCFGAPAATKAAAESCRAHQIMSNQCTWLALEELGGDRSAAERAEKLATSTLIDGCSPGQYRWCCCAGLQ